jgi:hypothetical protein
MNVKDYIKQHNHIAYCEALIFPNGEIIDARPSHVEALIRQTICDHSLTREQISEMMPNNASPLHWLIDRYNYGCVWYDSAIVSVDCTEAVLNTIQELINAGVLRNVVQINTTDEYKRCEILSSKNFDKAKLLNLKRMTVFMYKN